MKNTEKKKLNTQNIENKKPPFWFYLILLLIPVIFVLLLETGLRIFNYGKNTQMWINVTDDKIMLNPDFAYRYFYNTTNVPNSNENVFDAVKRSNAFRIFVLGGSSAAGYPFLPNGGFSNYLKHRLEKEIPGVYPEVINLSMSAINSYTLRDMLDGVLEKSPDLIIIYAGHNEYYGALGVGSTESIGNSPATVNFILKLNKFKTVQLLRNFIKGIISTFSSGNVKQGKGNTLMARMIEEQNIPYNSETFSGGINQFENNIEAILEKTKKAGIPVIMSTLTSNLKDQEPFVSIEDKTNNLPAAVDIFNQAKNEYNLNNLEQALTLFKQAKDLDQLRFRAPEEINNKIIRLSSKHSYSLVNFDSLFNAASPNGITGNNLMTDHLHPTLAGYRLMGEEYFNKIISLNLIKKNSTQNSSFNTTAVLENYTSELDSIIGNFRIAILKNDWPFSNSPIEDKSKLVKLNNHVDSIAFDAATGNITWIKAHEILANHYLKTNDIDNFLIEVNVLINQYPFMLENYKSAVELLLTKKMFDRALPYLIKMYNFEPNYFAAKWIGNISLNNKKTEKAIYYLSKAAEFDSNDPQLYYNLAGAYFINQNFDKAIESINLALQIDPHYPNANNFKNQLIQLRNSQAKSN